VSLASWPDHPLTLSEWDALPEDTTHRYELVEGTPHVCPRPLQVHQWALLQLCHQLLLALPDDFGVFPEPEVLLFDNPPTVRVPDIVVVPASAIRANSPRFAAEDVVLACEIVSPGSVRTDRITKLAEYADAGIGHYWLVDPKSTQVDVAVYELGREGYQQVAGAEAGKLTVSSPAPMILDLDQLRP
jgi:Uma2 family endonuclease